MHILDDLDNASLRTDVPAFRPGDTVDVGVRETFTVRKVSFGVGVERTFPVHTPVIEDIKVVVRGDVRRAKLYYLRELRGKKAKIKEKRDMRPAASSS